jgi:hypothetical protein
MQRSKAGLCPHIGTNGKVRWSPTPDMAETWLQGRITVKYKRLVQTFGPPTDKGDGYKVDAEWELATPDGAARVYNWKDGLNYNGAEGTPTEDITDWHIGGKTKAVVDWVLEALYTDQT